MNANLGVYAVGQRVVECQGTPSQRFGEIVDYRFCDGKGPFPFCLWDSGLSSFSSEDILRPAPYGQITLFEEAEDQLDGLINPPEPEEAIPFPQEVTEIEAKIADLRFSAAKNAQKRYKAQGGRYGTRQTLKMKKLEMDLYEEELRKHQGPISNLEAQMCSILVDWFQVGDRVRLKKIEPVFCEYRDKTGIVVERPKDPGFRLWLAIDLDEKTHPMNKAKKLRIHENPAHVDLLERAEHGHEHDRIEPSIGPQPGDWVVLHPSGLPKPKSISFRREPVSGELGEAIQVVDDCPALGSAQGKLGTIVEVCDRRNVMVEGDDLIPTFIQKQFLQKPRRLIGKDEIKPDTVFLLEDVLGQDVYLSYQGSEPFRWPLSSIAKVVTKPEVKSEQPEFGFKAGDRVQQGTGENARFGTVVSSEFREGKYETPTVEWDKETHPDRKRVAVPGETLQVLKRPTPVDLRKASEALETQEFKVGNRVYFAERANTGTVVEVQEGKVVVWFDHGHELDCSPNMIKLCEDQNRKDKWFIPGDTVRGVWKAGQNKIGTVKGPLLNKGSKKTPKPVATVEWQDRSESTIAFNQLAHAQLKTAFNPKFKVGDRVVVSDEELPVGEITSILDFPAPAGQAAIKFDLGYGHTKTRYFSLAKLTIAEPLVPPTPAGHGKDESRVQLPIAEPKPVEPAFKVGDYVRAHTKAPWGLTKAVWQVTEVSESHVMAIVPGEDFAAQEIPINHLHPASLQELRGLKEDLQTMKTRAHKAALRALQQHLGEVPPEGTTPVGVVKPGDRVRLNILPDEDMIVWSPTRPKFEVGELVRYQGHNGIPQGDWHRPGKILESGRGMIMVAFELIPNVTQQTLVAKDMLEVPPRTLKPGEINTSTVFTIEAIRGSRAMFTYDGCEPFEWFVYSVYEILPEVSEPPPPAPMSAMSPPEPETSDPLARRSALLAEVDQIRRSGEVAPTGCSIEVSPTYKKLAGGEKKRFNYWRVKADKAIFQHKDKMVKSLHLGLASSATYQDWTERINRRRQIARLEAQIDAIERQLQNRREEANA